MPAAGMEEGGGGEKRGGKACLNGRKGRGSWMGPASRPSLLNAQTRLRGRRLCSGRRNKGWMNGEGKGAEDQCMAHPPSSVTFSWKTGVKGEREDKGERHFHLCSLPTTGKEMRRCSKKRGLETERTDDNGPLPQGREGPLSPFEVKARKRRRRWGSGQAKGEGAGQACY